MVLLTMLTAVLLSTWMVVNDCGFPNSVRMIRMTFAFWELSNKAPSSASAADAVTSFKIAQVMKMLPFSLIGSPSFDKLPRKK